MTWKEMQSNDKKKQAHKLMKIALELEGLFLPGEAKQVFEIADRLLENK